MNKYEDAKTNLRSMRQFRAAGFLTKVFEMFGLRPALEVIENELKDTIEDFISRIDDFLDLDAKTPRIHLSHHLRVAGVMTVRRMKTSLIKNFMEHSGNLCEDPQDQPFLPYDFASYARIENDIRFFEKVKRAIVTYQWERSGGAQPDQQNQDQQDQQNQQDWDEQLEFEENQQ